MLVVNKKQWKKVNFADLNKKIFVLFISFWFHLQTDNIISDHIKWLPLLGIKRNIFFTENTALCFKYSMF